jgi:O-antigen ligase
MKGPNVDKAPILAVGLVVCLTAAVLAFGGVEPLSWSAVNLATFLLLGFVLWSTEARGARFHWPWAGTLLLLAYVGVQAAMIHGGRSLAREQMLRLGAYLCAFYVALFVARDRKSRSMLLAGLLGLGLFEALYGLVQYASGWQQIFTYKKVFYVAQATGTYVNPNHFAGLLEMILPLSLAGTLYRLERVWQSPGISQSTRRFAGAEGIARLAFSFFSTVLLYAAILFSRSRAGIFCASAAAIFTGVLWICSSRRPSRATLAVVCLLAGACLFGLWIGLGPVVERYETLLADYPSRLAVWKDSLALIRAHPLTGYGPGSFVNAFTQVQSTVLNRVVDHAHNDYLELAAEWGIPGAVLLMGLVFWLLARTTRACFLPAQSGLRFVALGCCGSILALLLHSAVDFNLQIPANALVLAAILGLSYSIGTAIALKSGSDWAGATQTG